MELDSEKSGCERDNLGTKLFPTQYPFSIPSGVVCTTPAVIARIAREVKEIGFLTTKTLSLHTRKGYREPVLNEYHPSCFINAVGLANPGAANFVHVMRPLLPLHDKKPLLVSIMGSDPDEFLECAWILSDIADAFELNLSCPHVKAAGLTIGTDPVMVEKIVSLLSKRLRKPIVPKLSPNVANVVEMAKLCEGSGASGLSLINTVGPGMVVDDLGNPILSNKLGGLSGAAIKPIGLKVVREISSEINLPIIASGGIASPIDVDAYRKAGASYFSVGSRLAGMSTPQIKRFFQWIASPINPQKTVVKTKRFGASAPMTAYSITHVVSNKKIGPDLFRLELETGPSCGPGQFLFLRLPEIGEKPFSPMIDVKPVYLVKSVGPFTRKLSTLKTGETIYFRGPYGNGFKAPKRENKIILVGGGTGSAPILMAATKWRENVIEAFFGFSESFEDWFASEIKAIAPTAKICVDKPGEPGAVLELIEREVNDPNRDFRNVSIYVCGPSVMMKRTGNLFTRFVRPKEVYLAREDIMKCGIGLCGSCGTENGLRSCIDGPVFPFGN